MNVPTTQDFDAILAALPNDSGNALAYNMLMSLRAASMVEKQPFTFELDFPALAAGATSAPTSFLVDASSPFMLCYQCYEADIAGATRTLNTAPVPNVSCSIQDQSGNRNWQNANVPIQNIFGNGQQPFVLPQPRLIPANTTVSVQLVSFEAAQAMTVRLSFIGFRFYS